jgi:DNA-binding FadR family transcriptional regulator
MFSMIRRVRAYEQIAEEVRDRILRGVIRPGDKLPGERDLAGQFGVNRSTVREALKSLSELGLVVVRHGGGAVVQDYFARAGLQILPYLFSRGAASAELWGSLLETRRIFAVEMTRLAVERAGEEERVALSQIVDQLEKAAAPLDLDRFQALDFDFVHALARGSHNAIFVLVMNSVRPVFEQQHEFFRPLYEDPQMILAAYRKIVGYIEDQDSDRAARAMDAVMRAGETRVHALLAGVPPPDRTPPRSRRGTARRAHRRT